MNDSLKKNLKSATNLAKELNLKPNDLFNILETKGFIMRKGTTWELTQKGKDKGGVYKKGSNIDRYIAWPSTISSELIDKTEVDRSSLITATSIGNNYGLSANRINSILSELGWIRKDPINGWHVTEMGKNAGGIEEKHAKSGVPFVRWTHKLLDNRIFHENVSQSIGDSTKAEEDEEISSNSSESKGFRDKFQAHLRAKDGHLVRSKSELIIDNYLYDAKIVHAYERKVQVEENIYCDFYIPTGKVYIEFWGMNDEKYLARKRRKVDIYKKYSLNLIELTEKDISSLDDTLPGKLRNFQVTIE